MPLSQTSVGSAEDEVLMTGSALAPMEHAAVVVPQQIPLRSSKRTTRGRGRRLAVPAPRKSQPPSGRTAAITAAPEPVPECVPVTEPLVQDLSGTVSQRANDTLRALTAMISDDSDDDVPTTTRILDKRTLKRKESDPLDETRLRTKRMRKNTYDVSDDDESDESESARQQGHEDEDEDEDVIAVASLSSVPGRLIASFLFEDDSPIDIPMAPNDTFNEIAQQIADREGVAENWIRLTLLKTSKMTNKLYFSPWKTLKTVLTENKMSPFHSNPLTFEVTIRKPTAAEREQMDQAQLDTIHQMDIDDTSGSNAAPDDAGPSRISLLPVASSPFHDSDASVDNGDSIALFVRCSDGFQARFNISKTKTVGDLISGFCKSTGLGSKEAECFLILDGEKLARATVIDTLDLEDDDILDTNVKK